MQQTVQNLFHWICVVKHKTMEYPWAELTEWIMTKQKNVERAQVGERKRLQMIQLVASEIESQ